jgi:hypothetical protein
MRYGREIEVARPVDELFAYVADVSGLKSVLDARPR